jgi:hypothetical protein
MKIGAVLVGEMGFDKVKWKLMNEIRWQNLMGFDEWVEEEENKRWK